ncbi:MAG: TRAP transporter small permease subunit, partial [Deltaproteobacteria bacterium]|nr:TRAP transporter small permease subunit [Deltaproteobacteria bacterium]
MNRLDHLIDKLEEYVCFVTLAIMSIAVLLQIINRSFLGRPFPYGEELARYMMVWATMFGTSAGVKIGAHVG